MKTLILWLAQGFGSGRIPFGPGTFGSLVGLLWMAALVAFNSPVIFVVGAILGIPLSVWVCGEGEKILKEKDPGSIVMDEIIAIPLSFMTWLAILHSQKNIWPAPDFFVSSPHWITSVAIFVLFRIFDIAKPWPIRASQKLTGGLGVTVDDVLASVYVNLVVLVVWWIKPSLLLDN